MSQLDCGEFRFVHARNDLLTSQTTEMMFFGLLGVGPRHGVLSWEFLCWRRRRTNCRVHKRLNRDPDTNPKGNKPNQVTASESALPHARAEWEETHSFESSSSGNVDERGSGAATMC